MITACFDAAPKESKEFKIYTVAGFASYAAVWNEFDERWIERLSRDGLQYFHPVEFAHSTGQFSSGWKGNEDRRRSLCGDLMEVIRSCGLRKFGYSLKQQYVADVLRKTGDPKGKFKFECYTWAALHCVLDFIWYARTHEQTSTVKAIFEKGDNEDNLRKAFAHLEIANVDFAWGKPLVNRKAIVAQPFYGLQAAGWLTYEYYLDHTRLADGTFTDKGRWAFEQFENVPGNVKVELRGDDRVKAEVEMALMRMGS